MTFFLLLVQFVSASNKHAYSKSDLRMLNAYNLLDVVQMSPIFHSYFSNQHKHYHYGVIDASTVAIYKNGVPLLADQNFSFNLASIAVWNLDSLVIEIGTWNNFGKNNSGIQIQLYSSQNLDLPYRIIASAASSNLQDLHTNIDIVRNYGRQSFNIQANRSFTNLPSNLDTRAQGWPALERYDLDATYNLNVVEGLDLSVSTSNSQLYSIFKTDVIPGTTRAKDIEERVRRSHFNSELSLALSKRHKLSLITVYSRYRSQQNAVNTDFASSKSESSSITEQLDTLGYRQGYMQVALKGQNYILDYETGLDIGNSKDIQFPNINAISTSYTDFSIFANLFYTKHDVIKMKGGLKFLNQSLAGSYLLPHLNIKANVSKTVSINASYNQSISYPQFSQLFYPYNLNGKIDNNLTLSPFQISSCNVNLQFNSKHLSVTNGLVINRLFNLAKMQDGTYLNAINSNNSFGYVNVGLNSENFELSSAVLLHSINTFRDSFNRVFFYPEFNFRGTIKLPQLKTKVNLSAKIVGSYPILQNQDGYKLALTDPFQLLNLAFENESFDNVSITFGLQNMLNQTLVLNTIYNIDSASQEFNYVQNASISRGRVWFLRLAYSIK